MQQGKILYHLQQLDITIIEHERRLQDINSELEDNAAVHAARAQLTAAEEALQPLQKATRELDLQLESTRSKRERTETRLYSGTVKNPKELQDMQNEIESLKRRRSTLEDDMLELMLEADDAQAAYDAADEQLAAVTAQTEAENAELIAERQTLLARVAEIKTQRAETATSIAADLLARYEQLRPRKANQPIALLRDDETCSACGIKQLGTLAKAIRQGDGLITCKNCQRILIAE